MDIIQKYIELTTKKEKSPIEKIGDHVIAPNSNVLTGSRIFTEDRSIDYSTVAELKEIEGRTTDPIYNMGSRGSRQLIGISRVNIAHLEILLWKKEAIEIQENKNVTITLKSNEVEITGQITSAIREDTMHGSYLNIELQIHNMKYYYNSQKEG